MVQVALDELENHLRKTEEFSFQRLMFEITSKYLTSDACKSLKFGGNSRLELHIF